MSSRPSSRNGSLTNSRASSGRSTPTSRSKVKTKQSPSQSNRSRSARQRLPLSNESSYVKARRTHRDNSPGRVLHDVQTKLDEYVNKQREKAIPPASAKEQLRVDENKLRSSKGNANGNDSRSAQSPGKKMFNDATAEIADIDTRLQALQHFLSNVRVDGKPST